MTWTAPQVPTGVPAVSGYALQYRKASQAPPARWLSWAHSGTGAEATITGLEASTTYEVQVAATNADGTGAWSDSGTGTTDAAGVAVTAVAVVSKPRLDRQRRRHQGDLRAGQQIVVDVTLG